MRLTHTCVCSTAHLPVQERRAFDELIDSSPRRSGRISVDHPVLSIETHQFGFAVHLGLLEDQPDRPPEVSDVLWALMVRATSLGAEWLSFDDEEGTAVDLAVFPDQPPAAQPGTEKNDNSANPERQTVRCATCGSPDVVCDASVQWDVDNLTWRLAQVFDAAWCDVCERDVELDRCALDARPPVPSPSDA
jgi:hypothetical protein